VLRYLKGPLVLRDALLTALTLLAMGGACGHPFVDLDDPLYVEANPDVLNGLNLRSIGWAFTTWTAANWHPLTWLSLQLDASLFGCEPHAFHRTNVLLHLANVLLLAEVLRRLTGALWPSAAVAALFAVHPLHVESVAWVSERKDVLSTLFGLLALGAYARYARQPSRSGMIGVCLAQAASLLAKPMLVTLPFLLLLLDFWPLRRGRPAAAGLARLLVEKTPLFLLSAASCGMTLLSQSAGGAVSPLTEVPFALRLANAVHATACYLGQTFWPADLVVLYPYPLAGLPWPTVLGQALFLVAVTVAVCRLARSRPYLAVGWFWFLGALVPVLGLVQVGAQARADRYTYVPHIGLFLMVVWGLRDLLGGRRGAGIALASGALLGCVLVTRAQVRHWESSLRLWEHAVTASRDNPYAEVSYARALLEQGEAEAALLHAERSLRLGPDRASAHFTRGQALAALGRAEEALACFRKAAELRPDDGRYRGALADAEAKHANKEAGPKAPGPRPSGSGGPPAPERPRP
jgi:hypothetical protein